MAQEKDNILQLVPLINKNYTTSKVANNIKVDVFGADELYLLCRHPNDSPSMHPAQLSVLSYASSSSLLSMKRKNLWCLSKTQVQIYAANIFMLVNSLHIS
jgi:hypothetical protein